MKAYKLNITQHSDYDEQELFIENLNGFIFQDMEYIVCWRNDKIEGRFAMICTSNRLLELYVYKSFEDKLDVNNYYIYKNDNKVIYINKSKIALIEYVNGWHEFRFTDGDIWGIKSDKNKLFPIDNSDSRISINVV